MKMLGDISISCRTCLQTGKKTKDLFSENHNPRLDEMLMSSTQLEANPLDGLPRVICINCTDKLYMAYMFKKMCHESEAILKKHSLDNVSKEQSQVSGERSKLKDSCIITNDLTLVSITNIPAVIKTEPDLNTDTLEDKFPSEENSRDGDAVTTNVPRRKSRKKSKYDCPKCNGTFHNVIQYQNHYCDKVGFACTKCNKNYASKVKLERHIKQMHDKELNNSSDSTVLTSGLLEIEYVPEANQNQNIKQETADDKDDRENVSVEEYNDDIKDDMTYFPGIGDDVSDVESTDPEEEDRDSESPDDEARDEKSKKKGTPKTKVQKSPRIRRIKKDPQKQQREPKEERLSCEYCTWKFRSESFLVNHMAREHGVGQQVFSCGDCHEMFPNKSLYRQHRKKEHITMSRKCNECGKQFPYRSGLLKHMRQVHTPKTKFICLTKFCKKIFSTKEELTKHKLEGVHTGSIDYTRFICNYCNREFSTKSIMRRHILNLHMGPVPYCVECNVCQRTFKTRSAMKLHAKVHTSDRSRKYLCTECGKGFLKSDALKVHIMRHRGEKNYVCQYCDKAFFRLGDKTMHERHHTNTKTHLCTICGKGFVRPCTLKIHMRTHTGEKPYQCTFCEWRCTQAHDLKVHIRRHTGERYTCELCSKDFLQSYLLKNHKLSAHGVYDPKVTTRVKKVSRPKEN